ncbi:MAG: lysophospholipid acyltransferase family protein [Prevotella sp.]|nr:lysophospholipid acyltransferase family protein [Prevotella sp.]
MKRTFYILLYILVYLISLLPLRVLYGISDFLYIIVYTVWGYRKKIVRKNLTESFPEKGRDELLAIEKGFYHWLCDYFVETIKLLSISRGNISRRMTFKNKDMVRKSFDNGRNVVLYLGHYCNWEWVSTLPLHFDGYKERVVFGQIYHPLENKPVNNLFLKLRGRAGATSISMTDTLRKIIQMKRDGKQWIIGFIADQVPLLQNIHYWGDFLNHDTPFFSGTATIAKRFDTDVYYLDMKRTKRGYYVGEFHLMTTQPMVLGEEEITTIYAKKLEESIRRQPQFWLWTHNRWKRTHEEFNLRYDPKTGKFDTRDLDEIRREKSLSSIEKVAFEVK